MGITRIGLCIECNDYKPKLIVKPSLSLCYHHNQQRLHRLKNKWNEGDGNNEEQGLLELFQEIWNERPHFSEISPLTPIREFSIHCFAHILSKGSHPSFTYYKPNIALVTPEEHDLYDNQTGKVLNNPMWRPFFEKKQLLKEEYNKLFKTPKHF